MNALFMNEDVDTRVECHWSKLRAGRSLNFASPGASSASSGTIAVLVQGGGSINLALNHGRRQRRRR